MSYFLCNYKGRLIEMGLRVGNYWRSRFSRIPPMAKNMWLYQLGGQE